MTASAERQKQPNSLPVHLEIELANEAVVYAGERLTVNINFNTNSSAGTGSANLRSSTDLSDGTHPSILRLGSQSLADLSQSLLQLDGNIHQSAKEELPSAAGKGYDDETDEYTVPGENMVVSSRQLAFEEQQRPGQQYSDDDVEVSRQIVAAQLILEQEKEKIVKASSIQKKLQPQTDSAAVAANSFLAWLWPFGGSTTATQTQSPDNLVVDSGEIETNDQNSPAIASAANDGLKPPSAENDPAIPVVLLHPSKVQQVQPIFAEDKLIRDGVNTSTNSSNQPQSRYNRFLTASETAHSSRSASPARTLGEQSLSPYNYHNNSSDHNSVNGNQSIMPHGSWQSIATITADQSLLLANTGSSRDDSSLKRQQLKPPAFQKVARPTSALLALGFIQTVGYLTVDKSWVKLPPEVEETKRMFTAEVGGASVRAVYDLLSADSKAVPIFITPPEILFGSMSLSAGEKKSYNYEVLLPDYLPPTHRGRVMKISYKVIIGIQRTILDKPQLFQVPFRVFHKLDSNGLFTEYPLAHPAVVGPNECTVYEADNFPKSPLSPEGRKRDEMDVLDFVNRTDLSGGTNLEHFSLSPKHKSLPEKRGVSLDRIIGICHIAKRASFDICKNNIHVANVHLYKTSYRLGETVTGVIDLSDSQIPCFHCSLYLESVEHVESGFAAKAAHELNREACTIVAEWHEFCLSSCRTGFSLAIPTMASPDFQTSGVGISWQLRVEFCTTRPDSRPLFKVVLPELTKPQSRDGIKELTCSVAPGAAQPLSPGRQGTVTTVGSTATTDGMILGSSSTEEEAAAKGYDGTLGFHAADKADVETFECVLPIRVYGTDWETGLLYPPSARYRL